MAAIDFPSSPTTDDIHTDANGIDWVYDGVRWVVVYQGKPTFTLKTASFTVAESDGFDHWYELDSVTARVCTIPTGLTIGHRFSVACDQSDHTFVTTGLTVQLPAGKTFVPEDTGAVIGIIVVATNTIRVFGGLL